MKKLAIIHGTKGSPEGNWFPWLTEQLKNTDVKVIVPRFPSPEAQSLTNWLTAFDEQVGVIDSSTIIIGHSIGAVCLLRILERIKTPISCSVFVAGLTGEIGIPEYDQLNSTFVGAQYDWETIRKNAGHAICFAGDNDPYVPTSQGEVIARELNVELQTIVGGGHLNAEFGFTSFPQLLERLLPKLLPRGSQRDIISD